MVSFSFKGVLYWTVGFSAVQSVRSFLDTDSSNNMAVYWGIFTSKTFLCFGMLIMARPEFWEFGAEAVEFLL